MPSLDIRDLTVAAASYTAGVSHLTESGGCESYVSALQVVPTAKLLSRQALHRLRPAAPRHARG